MIKKIPEKCLSDFLMVPIKLFDKIIVNKFSQDFPKNLTTRFSIGNILFLPVPSKIFFFGSETGTGTSISSSNIC